MGHYLLLVEERAREQSSRELLEEEGNRLSSSSGSQIQWADLDNLTSDQSQDGCAHIDSSESGTIRKLNRRHTFNNGVGGSDRVAVKRTPSLNEVQGSMPRRSVFQNGTMTRSKGFDRSVNLSANHSGSPVKPAAGLLSSKKPELSQGELLDRFKKIVTSAVDFVLFTGWIRYVCLYNY